MGAALHPLLADAARFARHLPDDRWFVDESYVKVNGVWRHVYRAIDQHGQVVDVLLARHRDMMANPTADILDRLAADVAAGRLTVPIERTYPLAEVPTAFSDFTTGTHGEIAIAVA